MQNEPLSEISGGLTILHDFPFSIERVSNAGTTTKKNHHYHNTYELYYLYSGDRYYFIKDKTYHVTRGNLVLIKPYDIHCTSNFSKSGYDRCLIMFKRSFIKELAEKITDVDLFECFDRDIHLIPLSFQEQSFVETLLSSMVNEHKTQAPGYRDFLRASMVQLLLLTCRHAATAPEIGEGYISPTHKTVSAVAAYINNNYNEDITLESVSERFFISPCYFSRTFKKITGISFTEYLNGVRIKEAQRLLATNEISIAELCEAVGYKSTTHFGRSFKSITGMSPTEYRRIKKRPAK